MDTETHYELETEIIDNINIFQIFENMEKEYKQIEGSKYYTTSKKYILSRILQVYLNYISDIERLILVLR